MKPNIIAGRTWDQLLKDPVGTLYHLENCGQFMFAIVRGPHSVNAYFGIPKTHPLAGKDYDDIPVECHGGWTYSGSGILTNPEWPEGYWWYGYDHSHCDDRMLFDYPGLDIRCAREGIEWTPERILRNADPVKWDFGNLVKITTPGWWRLFYLLRQSPGLMLHYLCRLYQCLRSRLVNRT